MDKIKTSKKSGKKYSPFGWEFNFAIKNLAFADFIKYPQRIYLSLTEKGRLVTPDDFEPKKEVRPLVDKVWEKFSNCFEGNILLKNKKSRHKILLFCVFT